jgi:DNA-binding MarR family transcriptional regulator
MSESPEPISFIILDLARLIRQDFETALDKAGLAITAGEARTLLWASRYPGLRQTVLAEKLNVDPMSLVAFLDRLEAAGLVTRQADPQDRRAKLIRATPAAADLIGRIDAIAIAVRERAMRDIDPASMETIRTGLTRMRNALAAKAAAVPP